MLGTLAALQRWGWYSPCQIARSQTERTSQMRDFVPETMAIRNSARHLLAGKPICGRFDLALPTEDGLVAVAKALAHN